MHTEGPCHALSHLRQGSTYQREIHSIDREIHRSRSSHPESKSGCVNDSDSTTTVNDINSAYFRLLHARHGFKHSTFIQPSQLLSRKCSCYLHFTQKVSRRRLSNLPQNTQIVNGTARIQTEGVWVQNLCF